VLAAAPLVLAYPLFLVLFGRNALAIIVLGFASGIAPVVLNTAQGFNSTRRVLLDVGRSLRLTPGQEFRMVLLPAALPQLFVGLRLALIFCLINVVGVEFLINFGGLGQLINDLSERYDLPGTYGAICLVVLVSVLFFVVLARGERWLRRRS
jgi:NitT/TauT family transport system permease protein